MPAGETSCRSAEPALLGLNANNAMISYIDRKATSPRKDVAFVAQALPPPGRQLRPQHRCHDAATRYEGDRGANGWRSLLTDRLANRFAVSTSDHSRLASDRCCSHREERDPTCTPARTLRNSDRDRALPISSNAAIEQSAAAATPGRSRRNAEPASNGQARIDEQGCRGRLVLGAQADARGRAAIAPSRRIVTGRAMPIKTFVGRTTSFITAVAIARDGHDATREPTRSVEMTLTMRAFPIVPDVYLDPGNAVTTSVGGSDGGKKAASADSSDIAGRSFHMILVLSGCR